MYNRPSLIVGLKLSVSRYFLLYLEYHTVGKMQQVSNRKSKIPGSEVSRVGPITLNDRTNEIILNANLMQQGDFINVFLAKNTLIKLPCYIKLAFQIIS